MKKIFPVLLLLLLSSCALISPNPNRVKDADESPLTLKPFTTDYCSEWPNGTNEDPKLWSHCCFTHDLHYWVGGTNTERENSDQELKECVKTSGSSLGGFLMYSGVRIGGVPGNASYSWGYGWTHDRKYSPISHEELQTAKNLLESSEYQSTPKTKALVDDFINRVLVKKLNY